MFFMTITTTIEHLTIASTPNVKTAFEQKAKSKEIKQYVKKVIQKQALRPQLEEVLAPVHSEFAKSGMSEDELDTVMNSVREKTCQDRLNASESSR